MKASTRTVEIVTYASEVRPDITSESEHDRDVIAWADANPVSYRIVTTQKSKAFGLGSSAYGGDARNPSPRSVLYRLAVLRHHVLGTDETDYPNRPGTAFETWRARFTLQRFSEKGFTGGLFQEHARWTDDKEYPRGCRQLDFTPDTLEEVIDQFLAWCDVGMRYENRTRITVDKKTVRTLGEGA